MRFKNSAHPILRVDDKTDILLVLCRATKTPLGHRRWALGLSHELTSLMSIVCLCSESGDAVDQTYLFPNMEKMNAYRQGFRIKPEDQFLRLGVKLNGLHELYPAILLLSGAIPKYNG